MLRVTRKWHTAIGGRCCFWEVGSSAWGLGTSAAAAGAGTGGGYGGCGAVSWLRFSRHGEEGGEAGGLDEAVLAVVHLQEAPPQLLLWSGRLGLCRAGGVSKCGRSAGVDKTWCVSGVTQCYNIRYSCVCRC